MEKQGSEQQEELRGSQEKRAQQSQANPVAVLLEWSGKKGTYALSVLLAIIGVVGGMVPYFAAGNMVVGIFNAVRDWSFYVQWACIAAVSYAVQIIFHHLSTTVSHIATFATIANLRIRLAQKLTRIPMGYVLDTPSGTLKRLLVEKVDSIETTLAHAVPELTSNITVVIAIFIYLGVLDWRLALATLLTIFVGLACMAGMMKDYEVWYQNTITTGKEMNNTSVEYVSGIEVIKAFGKTDSSYEKFEKAAHDGAYCFIDWMKATILFFTIGMAITPTTILTIIPVGGILFMHGSITAGELITVLILSVGMLAPLITVMSYTDDMAKIEIVFGEVQGILDRKEMERPEETSQQPEGNDIVIKNVKFSYEEGTEILHGVNLSIKEGSVNALVGPSGSGKSTIARLISALWDVDSGEITFGGVNIKDMSWDDYNTKIAYVAQDNYLFNRSVMDNIRMGRKGASDEDVIEAAKRCGCHDFIMRLEKGYDTIVGDAGGHLSGGERQRISIARAMLKGAPIVILDEATAYTDPESEAVIQRSIASMIKGKTLIVIAHRLSTIVDADQIIVVNDGYIDDIGTHEQLLEKKGLYNKMWIAHVSARDTVDGGEADV